MKISKFIPRPIFLAFALVVLLQALVMFLWASGALHPVIHRLHEEKPSLIGGAFTIKNLDGGTVTEKDLSGHFNLIYFGSASEVDVTPTELRVLAAALGELGEDAKRFKTYFVSLDPERDQPEKLKVFLADISPDFVGLTGTPEQIQGFAKAYHAYFRRIPDPKDAQNYSIDYSPLIYLMGPDGKFIKPFGYTTNAKRLAEGLKIVLE